jgi:hypothetical protein
MKRAVLFLMIALLGGCVTGPDATSVFEGTLTTIDVRSLAETAGTSVSEGVHTMYCSVDGAGYDTTIAAADSMVIGVYRSYDDGTVHFTVYLPGHFPAFD